mmetsp:Transcript_399/g.497  ORF Transcript_399/g.497 Transcript_399/m.497 type:complete len:240 (+) Transcript_399:240-959(+)
MRLGIYITDDRDARLLNFNTFQNFLKRWNSRGHEISVEGTSNGKLDSHSCLEVRLGNFSYNIAGLGRSTNSIVTIAEIVGNTDRLSTLLGSNLTKLRNNFLFKPNNGYHTRVSSIRCCLHCLSSCLCDLHTIRKGNCISEAKRRVFSQTKAHGTRSSIYSLLTLFLSKLLHSCHTSYKDGRLRNFGRVQKFLWSSDTAIQKVISKDFACFIKKFLCSGYIVAYFCTHSNELCTLPREHE